MAKISSGGGNSRAALWRFTGFLNKLVSVPLAAGIDFVELRLLQDDD
jgi:hypothetical protein